MKKHILFFSLIISTVTLCHKVTVSNMFGSEIKAEIAFAGGGICGRKQVLIPKGVSKNVQTGMCCMTALFIGANKKWHRADPARTGLGMSCRNNHFIVRRDKNGVPVIELQ